MKFLLPLSSEQISQSRFIYNIDGPSPQEIAAMTPAEVVDRLITSAEVNEEMQFLLVDSLISQLGDASDANLGRLADLMMIGETPTDRMNRDTIVARLRVLIDAYEEGDLDPAEAEPIVAVAPEVSPTALSAPNIDPDGTILARFEAMNPASRPMQRLIQRVNRLLERQAEEDPEGYEAQKEALIAYFENGLDTMDSNGSNFVDEGELNTFSEGLTTLARSIQQGTFEAPQVEVVDRETPVAQAVPLDMTTGAPLAMPENPADLLPPAATEDIEAVETFAGDTVLTEETSTHLETFLSNTPVNRSRFMSELISTLDYALDELPDANHQDFQRLINHYLQTELSFRTDRYNDGIDEIDLAAWTETFEARLTSFIENPESMNAYLIQNPILPDAVGEALTETNMRDLYEESGVYDLVLASIPEEADAVLRLAVSEEMSPERLQEMAQLIGMMNASIQQAQARIEAYPQFDHTYAEISIRELSEIKDRVLRGYNILNNPADLSDVNQRINGINNIVEAFVEQDVSALDTVEKQEQHQRLTDFLDSFETRFGNRSPEIISQARQHLLVGEIDQAIAALEPIIEHDLRRNWGNFLSSFQISHAEMGDQETIITAQLIANSDEALFQAIRYINEFDGAGEVARESLVTNDEAVSNHVVGYVEENKANFMESAQARVTQTLAHLEANDPVQFNLLSQQIENEGGMEALVDSFATEMAAIEGFEDYVSNNHRNNDNPELMELYANMEGYGLAFSDSTADIAGGALIGLITSGPVFYRGILQGVAKAGARIPTRQALAAQGRAFLRSESSGLGARTAAEASTTQMAKVGATAGFSRNTLNAFRISLNNLRSPSAIRQSLQRSFAAQIDDGARIIANFSDETLETIARAARRPGNGLNEALNRAVQVTRTQLDEAGRVVANTVEEVLPAAATVTERSMYNLGLSLGRIHGLSTRAVQNIVQQTQSLGRAALNTSDDLAARAAARSALLRTVQTLPRAQQVAVASALGTAGYLVSPDFSDISFGSPVQAATTDPAPVRLEPSALPTVDLGGDGVPTIDTAPAPLTDAIETLPMQRSISVTATNLRFRSKPSLEGEIVGQFNPDSALQIVNEDPVTADGYVWQKVTDQDGNEGYIAIEDENQSVQYAIINEYQGEAPDWAFTHPVNISSRISFRTGPGTGNDRVGYIDAGSEGVMSTGRTHIENGYVWAEVQNSDGGKGWMALSTEDGNRTYAELEDPS